MWLFMDMQAVQKCVSVYTYMYIHVYIYYFFK
jgi:hypothetical protein